MKKFFSFFKYMVFLAIGIFLLWLAFKNQDKDEIIEGFKSANYWWIGLSLFLMTLSHISRGMRWTMLIKPLGYNVSYRNSFYAVMIGYLANLALPRAGEITRCIILNRTNGVPINKLVGTVVIERILDFLILMTMVVAAVIIEFDRLKDFYFEKIHPGIENNLNQLLSPGILAIIAVLLIVGIGSLIYVNKKHKENPLIAKLRELIQGFFSGIKTIRNMENNWLFLAHSLFIWFMYFAMTYVVFFAFDATDHLDMIAGLAAFAIGSLGFIMPVQGGIGTFHWAVTEGLRLYNIDPADGLTYATLMHGSQTIAVIIIGALCYIGFLFYQRKKSKVARQNEQYQGAEG